MYLSPKSIDPCKVAIYIRWSTDDQGEGTTLDVQLEGCRHYALSQGWAVTENLTFIDDGHSGGTLDRPALGRLRSAVSRGEVDCVVVYKLDRLSRDVPDMIRLILDEWDGKCFVKSAREPIDTTTQTGRMFFYTLASYAEWERSVIKERTFSGKLRRAQEGRNPGIKPPYGYKKGDVPGTFAVIPHEAELVRRIYTMYRQGYGLVRLASTLNSEGLTCRQGRAWSQSTIMHILKNEAYKGNLVYGKHRMDSKRNKRYRNPQPYVSVPGVFPIIVEPQEWEAVQAIKRMRPAPIRGQSGRTVSSPHLLTGLLRCINCGSALVGAQCSYQKWRYDYYLCTGLLHKGKSVCDGSRIRQEVLNEIVTAKVTELYGSDIARRTYLDAVKRDLESKEASIRSSLSEVQEVLSKAEGRRKKLRLMVLDGQLSPDEYHVFLGDIEAESRGLEERHQRLEESLKSISALMGKQSVMEAWVKRLDEWDTLSPVERKELLRNFIQRIEVYKAPSSNELECVIVWRVPQESPTTTVDLTLPQRTRRRNARGRYTTSPA